MQEVEMKLPRMGESVAEATILKWLKSEGEKIEADEPVLEIATDKVDSEVPASTSGILKKKFFKEGDVVQVGAVLALIETEGDEIPLNKNLSSHNEAGKNNGSMHVQEKQSVAAQPAAKAGNATHFYSPLVRTIALQENISTGELDKIQGSGAEGRVTKKDMFLYIQNRKEAPPRPPEGRGSIALDSSFQASPEISKNVAAPNVEIIEMDRMRKLIAAHMVMSKRTSPHVTSFVEADVTNLVMWRNKIKSAFVKREGEKLTFTPLFIEAVARAIKDFPMINVSVEEDRIIVKKDINIGMATALPSGNLIVPIIRNADRMNLLGITKAVNDLANRARINKLGPDEIQGGTYTITNVGTFGNIMGTPIINQPQAAILALGAIKKKPAVIETPQGDSIGIRHIMFLSHSYDHRVIDGALGGSFVRRVADYLEQFDMNRSI